MWTPPSGAPAWAGGCTPASARSRRNAAPGRRCVTSPGNAASIAFHTRLGFHVEPGDLVVAGVPVHADHDGPGLHRVVLVRPVLDDHDPTAEESRAC